MEEIEHFSHENHPLNLINSEMIVGARFDGGDKKPQVIGCNACDKPISSGFAYACTKCRYFLHKACAQLPPTFNDPSLYHHPLILTRMTDPRSWKCAVCRIQKKSGMFSYTFEKDYIYIFKACIDCCVSRITRKAEADAIKEAGRIKIEHKGHPQHTLSLKLRPNVVLCDACKAKDEGLFYECDSCDFWIHKTCVSLAHTIDLPHHPNHKLIFCTYQVCLKCRANFYYSKRCLKYFFC
ncbi:uncharacterized protein LOC111915782 isoform X2 [Lactuca sativa]|uniref:uncharacterized protein LOC111915782 isoform X2 n=1 Tax=Lactuca sativa TaxID=4236 RepID=UPI000CD9EB65|nr:uncharacterized protein LOC111915782 isoform X2 [Lactuca sativa]